MKIKIAISSNKNFYHKTIPVLQKSLIDSGVKNEDIYIFCGQFDNFGLSEYNNSLFFQLDYSSFEYNSLICIAENYIESDYWFLIQDTCVVGRDFYNLLIKKTDTTKEKISLKYAPSMSIGSYRYSYLLKYRDDLIKLKNKDYSDKGLKSFKLWTISHEDYFLYKKEPHLCSTYDIENYGFSIKDRKQCNIYGTNTHRIKEYFPQLDIIKYKSNYGIGNNQGINL